MVKIRKLDSLFSKLIRGRDKVCLRCGTDKALQCSHVLPRTYISVRWSPLNAITLCYKCHIYWWHKYPHEASAWFDEMWPGRYMAIRAIANSHSKVSRIEILERLQKGLE